MVKSKFDTGNKTLYAFIALFTSAFIVPGAALYYLENPEKAKNSIKKQVGSIKEAVQKKTGTFIAWAKTDKEK